MVVRDALSEAVLRCVDRGLLSPTEARFQTPMISGVGSLAIYYVGHQTPVVVKIGSSVVLTEELAFFESAQRHLAGHGTELPFPRIMLNALTSDTGWIVMEAGRQCTLENQVYEDPLAMTLRDDWSAQLGAIVRNLAPVYEATAVGRPWTLESYHFHRRIAAVLESNAARQSVREILGPSENISLLRAATTSVNGQRYPSMDSLLLRAAELLPGIQQHVKALIHGDLQVRNIIPRRSGNDHLLVDPRIKWEGLADDQLGFGSPLYDAANLLHSVAGMSTILAHNDGARSKQLCLQIERGSDLISLRFDPSFWATTEQAIDKAEVVFSQHLPARFLAPGWLRHLHAYAAGSCIGWLKSAQAIRNPQTWFLTYAIGCRLLARACA